MPERLTTAGPATPRGVVLMLHGGAQHNLRPVDGRSLSLRRTHRMFETLRPRFADAGLATALLRFTVKGWNAGSEDGPAPVGDARWALARLHEEYAGLPIVLLGHSMGARTAVHVADDPAVAGVVGLAPWWDPRDPVGTLSGKHLAAAHGSRDRITSARRTRDYLDRAAGIAASTRLVDMGSVGHYMLSHVRHWNQVALAESIGAFEHVDCTCDR